MAGRTASAQLPPLIRGVVSASGVARGGLLLLDLRVSGGRSHLLSGTYPAVVCPPLAGLEGQGCRALGCRGAEGGLLSALPLHSSSLQCSHSIAFLQPLLHQGGCARGGHLGLNCQGCCGTCSTPFSGLLQPSVRSVEDLGVVASSHRPLPSQSFCGRVPLSDGDHSVCAPVRAPGLTGCPPSISRKRIFKCRFILPLVAFYASSSVARSTSSRLCALASPRLRRSSPGSWLLFQLFSILSVFVCVDTSTTG